jgi:hypothetical protein
MWKDIDPASLDAGLLNHLLQPEHSRNWNVGYSQAAAMLATAKNLRRVMGCYRRSDNLPLQPAHRLEKTVPRGFANGSRIDVPL